MHSKSYDHELCPSEHIPYRAKHKEQSGTLGAAIVADHADDARYWYVPGFYARKLIH